METPDVVSCSGQKFFGFAVGDVAVAEGVDVKDVVGTAGPEAGAEFFVVRAGQGRAAGAFFECGVVGGRVAGFGAFGVFFVPGVFGAAMGPVFLGAFDGVGVGADGEGGGGEMVDAGGAQGAGVIEPWGLSIFYLALIGGR